MLIADVIKIKWLHYCSEKNEWENDFLCSLADFDKLTSKQSEKLDQIYRMMRKHKGSMASRISSRPRKEKLDPTDYMGEYEYIHDFT